MNVRMMAGMTAAALLLAAGAAQPAWGTVITNGSFEQGVDPGVYATLTEGSTNITGWTIINGINNAPGSGSIDYIGTYWDASDGVRSLDLDGLTPGGVEQSFAAVPAQQYHVSFDMAGNPDGPPYIKVIVAMAGSTNTFSFSGSGTLTNMGWESKSFDFVATGSSVTLKFQSDTVPGGGLDAYGPALDNVVVIPIPEPATLGLLALGGLAMLRRKTKRQVL